MKNIPCVFLSLLFICTGCSSSRITHSWKAENLVAQNFNKIMVVCINRQADRNLAQQMETHFTDDLKRRGFNTLSSLQQFGPRAFGVAKENAMEEKLKNIGVDAIITIVLLNVQKEINYTGANTNFGEGFPYNNFQAYINALNSRVSDPAYYESSTRYFWECNLYDSNQKLFYSAQSTSFNPASTEKMAHIYGKKLVRNMVENKLLPR